MPELQGFQRKYLRSRAHHLDPVVMIGRNGLAPSVMEKIDASLDAHELIKIRFHDYDRDTEKNMCAEIAEKMKAELCGKIGHVGIFYRPQSDPDKRIVTLPKHQAR